MHERWSKGEDLHNRAISFSLHLLISAPAPPPQPHTVRVYQMNQSPVIKSAGSLALVNNLMPMLNSALTVISGLIKEQEYVCLCVRFSCRSCHEHHAASGELTRRLPPDPIDSDHPGFSWCTCRAGPQHGEDKKAGGVGARVEDRRNSRQWMIIIPPPPPPPPTPSRKSGLGPGTGPTSRAGDLAQVSVGEVSPAGRVWSVSCRAWQKEEERKRSHVHKRGGGRTLIWLRDLKCQITSNNLVFSTQ